MHDYQSPPTYSAASTNTSTYGTMTTASMLLAFFGFLRSSEVVALKVTDIALQEAAYSLQLRIQTSKTDLFRKGSTIHLTPSGDPALCPEAALRLFLEGHTGQGALFCFANGARLSKYRLTQLVKVLKRGRPSSLRLTQLPYWCSHGGSRGRRPRLADQGPREVAQRCLPRLHPRTR